MLHSLYVIHSRQTDPRHNLALEELLLHRVKPGECILYLWQNQHTVVIGRNQHAENECRIQALEADGGHLVRRLSGGGAVYHDLGNLNFTFLVTGEDYDVAKQTETILRAVQLVGIHAEKNGRNDLTVDGQKFSGHAYYRTGNQCYHHGTLMVAVDMAPLEKYLNVSPLKLQAKGVQSVRSRVANLRDFRPELTIQELEEALETAFSQVYGLPVQSLRYEDLDQQALAEGQARFSRPEWIYGDSRPMAVSREARFDWGLLRLDYDQQNGVITQAALWSDGLDADFLSQVPQLIQGCPLEAEALRARLSGQPDSVEEVTDGIVTLLTRNEETL
ncbi:MAG: lipoate--protein ligase [Clostridiales bacterium]|uniref:lipoate--protein ligase n=1 Tax=Evtepia sp. TaxID=2773933 RepID=UPI0029850A58|nr:lipoate--protein ligase [Evtepia sp.]MDD7289417.1 lipoate--protein ligase [Clostridiales bacterium]MDY3993305.1 lipoate--protein ligase [Evtepia sp.]MDY4430618.1 lipoate--protein ligase [Evtepia sp.]